MLKFNEIKQDYKNYKDICYIEYEGKWYGMDYNMILEDNNIAFMFQWEYIDDPVNMYKYYSCGKLDIETFLKMTYKEFIKYINEYIYFITRYVTHENTL